MKQTLLIILCLYVFGNAHSQGITLLYKGGGVSWDDPVNWIQINTPAGQTPVKRAPTELDNVVFSRSQSGLSTVYFISDSSDFNVGGNNSAGYRCRSMHVSNTTLYFDFRYNPDGAAALNVHTSNGGFVLIDSGSNLAHGYFYLHGGNPELNDLEIVNSTCGSLFSHGDWCEIHWEPNGRARFVNSTLGGWFFGSSSTGGKLYAENCTFNTTNINLGDNSLDTILNCSIANDGNNPYLSFHIGRNANFISSNVNITSFNTLDFYTSGSVLNGNVTIQYETSGGSNFHQEDPANPLPNIINGNFICDEGTLGISGDLKISGNFENHAGDLVIYPDTSHVVINGQDIFKIGGIKNYGNNVSITNCVQDYCHFNLEFFGNTNTNIYWPVGFPIDTLIINKTGCAKVTATNSLYVSGEARIKSGQLVLNPNESIPFKFVCAGDLNIYQGGGVFLRRDTAGVVANIAVDGAIYDYNPIADSTCTGLSNPYNGNITLFREGQNGGTNVITIVSASNIGNLNLIGQTGSDFMLGANLSVNNFGFINTGKLLLGEHDLVVNGHISNYGPTNYFVTNGLGKLQVNNIGNIETLFPVGPSPSSYNPVKLTNFGTPDNFRINVQPRVLSGGSTGNSYIAGVVNRTWNINESMPGASEVTLTLQWNVEDELSGFTRNTAYLSHYISGTWTTGTQMSASGSNPYSLTRTNMTDFSPFAVMGTTTVVPVSLLDFNGKYRDKAIELNWSTETGLNANYFTVEKSVDAVLFKPLTNIPAYSNSQGKKNYHYVDATFLKGINYYRVKMIDFDGSYSYSKTIAVSAPTDHIFIVFPNPVKDQLFIRLQAGSNKTTLRIIDIKGTCVRTLKLKAGIAATSMNITDLPANVYSIIFESGKLKETLQFIKQ